MVSSGYLIFRSIVLVIKNCFGFAGVGWAKGGTSGAGGKGVVRGAFSHLTRSKIDCWGLFVLYLGVTGKMRWKMEGF